MGRPPGWVAAKTGRAPMPSPGAAAGVVEGAAPALLGLDGAGVDERARGAGGRRVRAGRFALVPPRWRHVAHVADSHDGALLVAAGTGGHRGAEGGWQGGPADCRGDRSVAIDGVAGAAGATRQRVAAGWTIGRRSRSGTASCGRGVPSRASLRATTGCAVTSRTGCTVSSTGPTAHRSRARPSGGSGVDTDAVLIAGGRERGARSRLRSAAAGLRRG